MTIIVGSNGFGRIGRQVDKAIRDHYDDKIDIGALRGGQRLGALIRPEVPAVAQGAGKGRR
jgi:hypothetical protein